MSDGEVRDYFFCRPGDDVKITIPTAGSPPRGVDDVVTVVDLYESKMSEYDSTLAFMPLEALQDLRGMIDAESNVRYVTSIQIKLKPGADLNAARDRLQSRFPINEYPYRIQTWRDMQGPLLAAVQLETTILNILLFLIIAVAGFRHPGHVLHDRGREDARRGHPESAGSTQPRRDEHLPRLRLLAGPGRLRRGTRPGPALRALHQRDCRGAGVG